MSRMRFIGLPIIAQTRPGWPSPTATAAVYNVAVEFHLLSILIPVFNEKDTIESILDLVRSAPLPDGMEREIIVVDDGSTDDTPHLMTGYGDRIRYHQLPKNAGIAVARTVGCRLAKGEFIAFQDDDDIFLPNRIPDLMRAFQSHPEAIMAVGDYAIVDADGHPTGQRWLPDRSLNEALVQWVPEAYEAVLWPTLPVSPLTTLFRRRDGEAVGWFDPWFRFASEDKDFFARLAKRGGIAYIPKVMALVRRRHESLTRNAIRTEYYSMHLFYRHMQLLAAEGRLQSRMYSRLQERIRIALQRIAAVRSADTKLPDYIPRDRKSVV